MTAPSVGQTLVGPGGNDTLSGSSDNDTIGGDGLPIAVKDPFSLRIKASADLWWDAPKMKVWADQTLLGEVDVSAVHESGEWQDFTFTRVGLSSAAKIRIEYTNDASGGSSTMDRNLWIGEIEVNGTVLTPDQAVYDHGTKTQAGQSGLLWGGALVFNTADHPALTPPELLPGGSDTAGFLGNRAGYTVTAEADGSLLGTRAGDQDRLAGIENLQFADGTFTLKELVPVAGSDVAATRENTEVMIDELVNDTVPVGKTVLLTDVGNAANGMVSINDDGTLIYRPNDYWSGRDSFTYSLSDGKHGTTTGTVTVEVSAVADKPLLSVDGTLHAEVKPTKPTLVPLDISANLVDLDGSENLTVMISKVPPGVTFTAGMHDNSGNWIVLPSELVGLQMILPAGFADNFTLGVAARALETSNSSLASTYQTVDVKLTQAKPWDWESADWGSVPTPIPKPISPSKVVVHASGDAYKGPAVFSLWVDGQKIGQSVSVEASHKQGQWQDFVFNLPKGADPKKIEILFENDNVGNSGGDRNLYVKYVDAQGKRLDPSAGQYERLGKSPLTGQEALLWAGKLVFSGNITVKASGDFAGRTPPKFDLYVNDVKVGDTASVTASHASKWQTISFNAPLGITAHSKIELRYINDQNTKDQAPGDYRDLFVDYIEVNGTRIEAETATYMRSGMTPITNTEWMPWAGSLIFNGPVVSIPPAVIPLKHGNVLKAPDLPEATKSGEIVSLQFKNTTGKEQAAGEITFGHVFKQGDLGPGKYLVAVIDGHEVPVQLDVKATNEDGSVRHALLTIAQPSLAAGATVNLMLKVVDHPPAGASITPADILAHGYDVDINLDLKNKDGTVTNFTVDAAAELAKAAANGTLKTWMSGPLASEFRVVKAINDHLTATLDIRAFKDGSVRTDVIMGVESSYKPGMLDFYNYDIKVFGRGIDEPYAMTSIAHYRNTTWHKEVWSGNRPDIHVVYDVDYLEQTGAVASIDSSMGVLSSEVGRGAIYHDMTDVAGREDIGIMPAWNARSLASQDATALKTMLANADAGGSIPWHYRDEATGEYLRIDQHPKLWMNPDQSGTGSDRLANGFVNGKELWEAVGWKMDNEHQPALNYLPYLVTGSQYYLDGLMAQSAYSVGAFNPASRGEDDGFVDVGQVRGRAWTWRNMSDAAYITPDKDAMKGYFEKLVDSNLDALVKRYITDGAMHKYDQIEGFFWDSRWADAPGDHDDGTLLVWQSDFVATVLGSIAERGNSQAVELLKWMDNFTSGRFIHGDDGFDPRFGADYALKVNSTNNIQTYTTWADLFKGSVDPKDPPPAVIKGTPDSAFSYAAIAKAAVASIFSATQSPDAMEAFGFLAKSIIGATNGAVPFYGDPAWNIAPKLSDGSHLTFDDIFITRSSGPQTLTGSELTSPDKNELIHGSFGNDTVSGGKGIDILFGAQGDDTLNGGPGDDFLYGGTGNDSRPGWTGNGWTGTDNDRISGGAGNDYLKGNAGSDTFVFGTDAGGRDTIGDFHIGTDLLEIKANLNGNGLKSATQILDTATADADHNAVLHLGSGIEIILIGIHTSNLKADMIHLN
jgi:hypothetical protein